ncbi:MAG: DUF3127 domain-containing protein [Muribaculaceae bacterium]|nr:DUF3127 domain-containing protein [Muribaculaceae bacterium]
MEIEGKIIMDLPEEGGTSKAGNVWRKKSYVLETMGQYPRKAKFDIFGDRIDNFHFEIGKTYKVQVDVESREFNGRWYTDLRAFSAQETNLAPTGAPQPAQQPFGGAPAPAPATPADPFAAPAASADPFGSSETDDLPF